MSPVPTTPCDGWTPQWLCSLPTGAEAVSGLAIQAAAEVLDSFTGRRYGGCEMTIRPCRRECYQGVWPSATGTVWWEWGSWPRPLFYNGVWMNLTCGAGCGDNCSCSIISEVMLPAPVSGISEVKIDGTVLSSSAYRLDDYRRLVRVDGSEWPICNDLTLDDTETNTWSITLTVGLPLPPLGQMALGELALEFIKMLLCNEGCKLPKPVQSMTRQGVTMNFIDPGEIFSAGHIGLYLCDLFVRTENPNQLQMPSRVYDIDGGNYRIVS